MTIEHAPVQAPDFELHDLSDQPLRLSAYRGKQHIVLALLRGLW